MKFSYMSVLSQDSVEVALALYVRQTSMSPLHTFLLIGVANFDSSNIEAEPPSSDWVL